MKTIGTVACVVCAFALAGCEVQRVVDVGAADEVAVRAVACMAGDELCVYIHNCTKRDRLVR